MLIHRQNSYVPGSKRRTGRREAQSRGPGPHTKIFPCRCLISLYTTNWFGRAITQAVCRRFPAAAARIHSCGVCGGQNGIRAGFSRVLWFPLTVLSPRSSIIIIIIIVVVQVWYSWLTSGQRTGWTQSYTTPRKRTNNVMIMGKRDFNANACFGTPGPVYCSYWIYRCAWECRMSSSECLHFEWKHIQSSSRLQNILRLQFCSKGISVRNVNNFSTD
jgi:hypothetical protein